MIQEVRTRLSSGETVIIRVAADDPHWREKALASLGPLSDLAFAIRSAPRTPVEVAAWDEYCRRRDLIYELAELAAGVRELQAAVHDELGGVE